MKVSEKLIGFRVYQDSTDYIGLADVTLPTLEAMTETVSGAGIAGEVDSPTLGHYGSMETVLNWRTLEKTNMGLAAPNGVQLDMRGAQQVYDSSAGKYVVRPVNTLCVRLKLLLSASRKTPSLVNWKSELLPILQIRWKPLT